MISSHGFAAVASCVVCQSPFTHLCMTEYEKLFKKKLNYAIIAGFFFKISVDTYIFLSMSRSTLALLLRQKWLTWESDTVSVNPVWHQSGIQAVVYLSSYVCACGLQPVWFICLSDKAEIHTRMEMPKEKAWRSFLRYKSSTACIPNCHLYLILYHMIFWILKFMLMSPLRSEIRSTGIKLLVIIIMTVKDLRMELFQVQVLNFANQSHR